MNTTPSTPAKYWLVTWTTYGTWLPGDPRGFRTWRGKVYVPPPARYGDSGESVYDPSHYVDRYQVAVDAVERPVLLSTSQRQAVLDLAYAAHPERFVKGLPTPPELPQDVWINPPQALALDQETENLVQTQPLSSSEVRLDFAKDEKQQQQVLLPT